MIIISIQKMARSKSTRKGAGKDVYSIVVDGETEVWYFQLLKPYQSFAIENAKRLGGFDIENYSTGKAGIYKIVELLNL